MRVEKREFAREFFLKKATESTTEKDRASIYHILTMYIDSFNLPVRYPEEASDLTIRILHPVYKTLVLVRVCTVFQKL